MINRIRRIGELVDVDMTETATLAQMWLALQIHEALDPAGTASGTASIRGRAGADHRPGPGDHGT